MLKTWIAVTAGKLAAWASKTLTKGAGTSLPGVVALKVFPQVLKALAHQVPKQGIIGITGTNGKTTSAGLIAAFLEAKPAQVIHNQLGANMLSGITSALLLQTDATACLKADNLVLEIDEASLTKVTAQAPLHTLAVTNLFRDQLDRYGELDTTAQFIINAFPNVSGAIILNADEPLVASMGKHIPTGVKPLFFGIDSLPFGQSDSDSRPFSRLERWEQILGMRNGEPQVYTEVHEDSSTANDNEDAPDIESCNRSSVQADGGVPFPLEVCSCPSCGTDLSYTHRFYAQVGHYHCENCGYQRPTPSVLGTVLKQSPAEAVLKIQAPALGQTEPFELKTSLVGTFNLYNLLLAVTVGLLHGVSPKTMQLALNAYEGVFGRAERRMVQGKAVQVLLIKNPAGATEVLKLVEQDPNARLLIAINDDYADGRDVSWLWDAPFERLTKATAPLFVSGRRSGDMAVRLQYAGVSANAIIEQEALKIGLKQALDAVQPHETLYILPTYTVLLQLRTLWDELR